MSEKPCALLYVPSRLKPVPIPILAIGVSVLGNGFVELEGYVEKDVVFYLKSLVECDDAQRVRVEIPTYMFESGDIIEGGCYSPKIWEFRKAKKEKDGLTWVNVPLQGVFRMSESNCG